MAIVFGFSVTVWFALVACEGLSLSRVATVTGLLPSVSAQSSRAMGWRCVALGVARHSSSSIVGRKRDLLYSAGWAPRELRGENANIRNHVAKGDRLMEQPLKAEMKLAADYSPGCCPSSPLSKEAT